MRKIEVLDTTLRDGEQAPGFSMNLQQKLEIAKQLERLKVDVIEAGFPIASTEDFNAVRAIAREVTQAKVAAFSRAIPHDITRAYEAVRVAESPRIHIFLATSDIHLRHKLKISREECLAQGIEAVTFARRFCDDIQFTLEDATRTCPEFLITMATELTKAGATIITIADTVGYATPEEFGELVARCIAEVPEAQFGAHCHNDLGMANANALNAVLAGVSQVDCSICGIGERAGMTALEEFVMALRTRKEYYQARTDINPKEFYRASQLLSTITEHIIPVTKPIVGENAFAHEAGVHQHGMLAHPSTYEIFSPSDVGVFSKSLVLGKHSGKTALQQKLSELGYHLSEQELDTAFTRYKTIAESKPYLRAEELELLIHGEVSVQPYFNLVDFVANTGTNITSSAVVTLRHQETILQEVATGETVVIAAFNAVDKIIQHSYPLHHFTIQSISEGREELGEASVQIWHNEKIISGRGIHTDIVEASIKAYLNAINKALRIEE